MALIQVFWLLRFLQITEVVQHWSSDRDDSQPKVKENGKLNLVENGW